MRSPRMLGALLMSVAVLAGMAFMAAAGAPAHYPLVNGGALAIALAVIAFVRPRVGAAAPLLLAGVALLWVPVMLSAGIDGVMRWVVVGPIRLHTGFVAMPMLIALLPKAGERMAIVCIGLASLALALQPDRASAFALSCGLAAIAVVRPDVWTIARSAIALLAFGVTFAQADPLAPVPFVENVLRDAWALHPMIAVALAAPIAALLLVSSIASRSYGALAATTGGFLIASMSGAYPVPLIGYGAASIIGFGIALAIADLDTE